MWALAMSIGSPSINEINPINFGWKSAVKSYTLLTEREVPMKSLEKFNKSFGLVLVFILALFAGLGSAMALDTAVVGQPYSYYGGYYGAPYAPYAYPGVYANNPNPALNPGPANPFFLSTVAGRGNPNWGRAQTSGRFILNNPVPGQNYMP